MASKEELKTIGRKINDIIDGHSQIMNDKEGSEQIKKHLREAQKGAEKIYDRLNEQREIPTKK